VVYRLKCHSAVGPATSRGVGQQILQSVSVDGDGGESSLGRTDAKATSSPMKGVTEYPSMSRDCHTFYGPAGMKGYVNG